MSTINIIISTTLLLLCCVLFGCGGESAEVESIPGSQGNGPPTEFTVQANQSVADALALTDQRDFEDATRGFIAQPEELQVWLPDGTVAWDMTSYDFVTGDSPDSVNPSLWRQAKLNNIHGLFEVTEGVYQIRGFDLANMSIIEGERGWIIVDPLTSRETAAEAIAFARKHLTSRPVSAVILTHSHIDHFGGVLSVMEADRSTEVFAPVGFMEEATSENVLVGSTMSRRAMFMYGNRLERSPRGHVDTGLGKMPAAGSPGITQPTRIIDTTGESIHIDGVEFIFQNAAGSEAPAELTFYLPDKKAFCGAEVVSRNMHNLYTLRGAKVRDARKWGNYIDEALRLFSDTEVYFASHHWPMWGNAKIIDFLEKQRDGYLYIHDQTLRLAASGLTPREIAEEIQLPDALAASFPNRGYYGTLKHNSKAVYQRYFGWFDGNPANLDPLPPVESARRYVETMGGGEALLTRARADFDNGDYRWVAELLNHLVFADPENNDAKALLADTYDQLAYRAESGPWRDVYLSGALELRHGLPSRGMGLSNAGDLLRKTPPVEFMKLLAVMLNGPAASGKNYVINFDFTDIDEVHTLAIENSVLHHSTGKASPDAQATVRITHELFVNMLIGNAGFRDIMLSDDVAIEGSSVDLLRFFSLLEVPDDTFDIVTP